MYHLIYKYLKENNSITLPSIGAFSSSHIPAVINFADKDIQAPSYSITFSTNEGSADKNLYSFIARSLNINETEAVQKFNDFVFDLKQKLSTAKKISLPGLGSILKNTNGKNYFEAAENIASGTTVASNKVIHKNSEHTIKVGETERTNVQMQEYFDEQQTKSSFKDNWLLWSAMLAIVAVAAICIYFFVIRPKGF